MSNHTHWANSCSACDKRSIFSSPENFIKTEHHIYMHWSNGSTSITSATRESSTTADTIRTYSPPEMSGLYMNTFERTSTTTPSFTNTEHSPTLPLTQNGRRSQLQRQRRRPYLRPFLPAHEILSSTMTRSENTHDQNPESALHTFLDQARSSSFPNR